MRITIHVPSVLIGALSIVTLSAVPQDPEPGVLELVRTRRLEVVDAEGHVIVVADANPARMAQGAGEVILSGLQGEGGLLIVRAEERDQGFMVAQGEVTPMEVLSALLHPKGGGNARAGISVVLGAIQQSYIMNNTTRLPESLDELLEVDESGYAFLASPEDLLDPWGNRFRYEMPPTPNLRDVLVYSLGRDGVPGGEGENADVYLSAPRSLARVGISVILQAIQQYYIANNTTRLPESLDELLEDDENGYSFLASPEDLLDPWGNRFRYELPPTPNYRDVLVYSLGRDGVQGGEGEDADVYLDEDGDR